MVKRFRKGEYWSLTISYSLIILLISLIVTLIIAVIVFVLMRQGVLEPGKVQIKTGHLIVGVLALSVIIGLILAFASSRFALRPFNKALISMNRLAGGDYSARIAIKGTYRRIPWMNDMAQSFNKMARELEQTEMLRSDFVNNFSHEFKTPIVSIAGFAKLMKRGNLSKEKMDEYLDAIEEEALRLSHMATNVLNLTNIENQTILTDTEYYNLTEQMRTAVLLLERNWSKKQIELELPEEEYYIEANEKQMEQVWINLLDNAVKFSPECGTVEVSISQSEWRTHISVANAGEPISAVKREKIFNKFYQGDESHSVEGNGIGLAVVKKIVGLHHGTIRVDSSDGKVIFTVDVPNKQR